MTENLPLLAYFAIQAAVILPLSYAVYRQLLAKNRTALLLQFGELNKAKMAAEYNAKSIDDKIAHQTANLNTIHYHLKRGQARAAELKAKNFNAPDAADKETKAGITQIA